MVSYTFDRINRIIEVDLPDTEITIQSLHDAVRDYEDELQNMDLPQIISSAGKENLGGGVSVGITSTLLDGWHVRFAARPGPTYVPCLISGGNLVTEDASIPYVGSAYVTIGLSASSSATSSDSDAIQFSSFGGGVSVDTTSTNTGTEYPVGNKEFPVNNIPDANLIASARGFKTLYIIGDITLGIGDDISNKKLIGENASRSTFTIEVGAVTDSCEILEAHVGGDLDSGIIVRNSMITNLNYVDGVVFNTMINPGTIILGNNATGHFINCMSGVPGVSTPTIDLNGSGQALAMRKYSGGVKLINKTGTDPCSIDLDSGQVKLDLTTVTGGSIVVRGDGKVIDDSDGSLMLSGTYGGLTLINETTPSKEEIRDVILDAPIANHITTGSVGKKIKDNMTLVDYIGGKDI